MKTELRKNTRVLKTKVLSVCVLLFLTVSCTEKQEELGIIGGGAKSTRSESSGVTLGRRLVNPYTLANMQAAYNSLHAGDNIPFMALTPTHKYISITIQDTSELTCLLKDTTIVVSQFPLDYELIDTGFYMPDEEYGHTVYAVVPYNMDLKFSEYELIDDCVIPDEDDAELQEVEYKSWELTGNLKKEEDNDGGTRCLTPHYPQGYIKVYNTETQQAEAVRNVKVRLHTFVKVRDVYTSEYGYYYTNTPFYADNIYYHVIYDNRKSSFAIWDNNFAVLPASLYLGKKSSSGYSYTMWASSSGWRASTVNNAVDIYRQRLCSDLELTKLPTNNLRLALMHMDALEWGGSTPMFYHRVRNDLSFNEFMGLVAASSGLVLALPDMFLFTNDIDTRHQYHLVFHEMSHVLHFAQVGGTYWAQFVDDVIANLGYGDSNSSWLSERVGVSEMWGYFAEGVLEQYCWNHYYSHPVDTIYYGNAHWFKPQILYTINEEIPSISAMEILDCLQSNVATFISFRNEIKRHTHFAHYAYIDYLFRELCD